MTYIIAWELQRQGHPDVSRGKSKDCKGCRGSSQEGSCQLQILRISQGIKEINKNDLL